MVCGFSLYTAAVLVAPLRHVISSSVLDTVLHVAVWYSGAPIFAGFCLCAVDLFVLLPRRKLGRAVVRVDDPLESTLTVVLTSYNDEQSIGTAVADFRSHPSVRRVIVIDNHSSDRSADVAREAGAEVIIEKRPGYGRCVYRALCEGSRFTDTELTLLCEGDMTFRAYDIDKFLAYIAHADIVNGTRIVEQLREEHTQLTVFMYYGNFAVGKLLEVKHLGAGTFTDVGTTYKLCRNSVLRGLLPVLDPSVNLEFNAHFLDRALSCGVQIVECPITFHNRVGLSKGGNTNNRRALTVGLRMIAGMVLSWKCLARSEH